MKHYGRYMFFFAVLAFISAVPLHTAQALQISYQAADLADTAAGEDLWQYTYIVTDDTISAGTCFSIYFDLGSYANLDAAPSAPGNWDVMTFQPDGALGVPGVFDALALTDSIAVADEFSVSFVWQGSGAPGAQSFEVYDASGWTIIDTGTTRPASQAVPEPVTMLLLATGFLGLAALKRG